MKKLLLLGAALLITAATPAALGSAQRDQVDTIGADVDVNRDGVVDTADSLNGILLFFDDAAPIRADIISGYLDLDGDGLINEPSDSLANADLTWKFGVLASPISKEVDIINGQVDVDGGGSAIPMTSFLADLDLNGVIEVTSCFVGDCLCLV